MLGVIPLQILVYITLQLAIAAITIYNNANVAITSGSDLAAAPINS